LGICQRARPTRRHLLSSDYDAIVFDQWGVLHNGSLPYDGAIDAVNALGSARCKLGILSNSGKRAAPNADRIAGMGFDASVFDYVMTSGEALWRDVDSASISQRAFFPIERAQGDGEAWADGLSISLVSDLAKAEAVLLMGLPDEAEIADWEPQLKDWLARGLPVYCSNPDRSSPREGGLVISPGALAFSYASMGGDVTFYGKPHRPVFDALEDVFCTATNSRAVMTMSCLHRSPRKRAATCPHTASKESANDLSRFVD